MAKQRRNIISRFVKRNFPDVEKVINARKGVKIIVRKRDCGVDAKRKDPTECALARAMKREYKADGVVIGLTASYVIRGKKALRFATPESVQRELVSFDRHHDFAPGVYRLAPVPPSTREKQNSGTPTSGSRRKRFVHKTVRVRTIQ